MNVFELARNRAFWCLDFIKGSKIKKHFNDLQFSFSDIDSARKKAEQRLTSILNHAVKTTPFYKKYECFQSLTDFPIIQKKLIKEKYNDFLSSSYKGKKLFRTTTSGSYGTPFTFLLSMEKRNRQIAEVIFFNQWAGYKIGIRYAQVRTIPKSKISLFLQNAIHIDPSKIDNNWLEKNRNLLKNENIKFIIGYPSAINIIAEYCRQKGEKPHNFSLIGIISGAEPLTVEVQNTLQEVFGCIVLDRYSSNELGVISHQCPDYKKHHINFTTHKIELIKINNDEPVNKGEIGRVVVTDFFSHAMPLIRYDTGDLACWDQNNCQCGLDVPIFEKILGRTVETVSDCSGKMVNPLAITGILRDVENVIQYQLIQNDKCDYTVKIHKLQSYNIENENIIKSRLKNIFGSNSNIEFEYVDTIPPLPSGKRPCIVNEFNKTSDN